VDFAHIHLMLNHVPVIGVAFGLFILFGGVAARSKAVTRVGLGLLAFSAIVAIPEITEFNIGHNIISRAVFVGLNQAVKEMIEAIAV